MTFLDRQMEKWLEAKSSPFYEKWFVGNIDIPANQNIPLKLQVIVSFNKAVIQLNKVRLSYLRF